MKKSLLFLGFLIIIAACVDRSIKEDFDYGKVVNGAYVNKFFNISIDIPKAWVVQSKEVQDQLKKRGADLVAGDDQSLKAQMKASEVSTAQLLMVSKYEIGAPVDFNPSFILVAENVKGFPGIKDGRDYLYHAKELLSKSQLQMEVNEGFEKRTLGGREYYIMTAKLTMGGKIIEQQYVTAVIDQFCFTFIISYASENDKKDLNDVLASIKKI